MDNYTLNDLLVLYIQAEEVTVPDANDYILLFSPTIGVGKNFRKFSITGGTSNETKLKQVLSNAGDNVITFGTPFINNTWGFAGIPLCLDSKGNAVLPTITNRTANGFTVNIGDTGSIECSIVA